VTEQLLDVKRVLGLVSRHRRLVAVFALVGLVVSLLWVMTRPPLYSSSALVLLPGTAAASTNGGQAAGNDMSTDAQIATSAVILAQAGHRVDPSLSLAQLRSRVQAAGTATNILRITAEETTPDKAKRLANNVASGLVQFVTTSGSAANVSGIAALRAEASQLTQQINNVNGEVSTITARINQEGASSPAGQQDTALLTAVTSQQSQSNLQLQTVNSQIAIAQLGSSAANAGTEVIQNATVASKPSVLGSVFLVLLGLIIGALVGCVVVVFAFRGDRRIRRRDQMAEAIGTPVVLSLATSRRNRAREWADFFEHYEPTANERWRVRKTLRDLDIREGHPSTLVVVSLHADPEALCVAPQLALTTASLGLATSLIVMGKDQRAVDLRVVVERLSTRLTRPGLKLQKEGGASELTVIAMTVDQIRPEILSMGASAILLAVSPGVATMEDLARVAMVAADTDQPIAGLVVANPDPDDVIVARLDAVTRPTTADDRRSTQRGSGQLR
jgi:capsular polysaccharide biosynthesis protein